MFAGGLMLAFGSFFVGLVNIGGGDSV